MATDKEALLDLLLVYSGGAVKFLNPVAARRASDLHYMDDFDSTKIHDVKIVKTSTKPTLPEAGRVAFAPKAGARIRAMVNSQPSQFIGEYS